MNNILFGLFFSICFINTTHGNEKIISSINDKNGLAYEKNQTKPFTGLLLLKHTNGQDSKKVAYINGKKAGLEIWWYENGKKMIEENYKDGKKNGLSILWKKNGQKMIEENYKDGKKNGLETFWQEDGQKMSETNYIDDKIVNSK